VDVFRYVRECIFIFTGVVSSVGMNTRPERELCPLILQLDTRSNESDSNREPTSLEVGPPLFRFVGTQPGVSGPPHIHFDIYNLIVQSDGDGGDTAQRTGMFFYVHGDRLAFEAALNRLEMSPGIYARHPYQEGFRSNPARFSRDQQRPLVIALGKYRMYDRLKRLTVEHVKRFGKYQNLDFIGPTNISEYIRAFRAQALYPVLYFSDLGLLTDSILNVASSYFNRDQTDDNNHVLTLLQSQDIMPTPVSWLARKIYKYFRARNFGNTILGEDSPIQGALAWYHRSESGGNPLIAESYRELIQNL
jgi:hypothetical protein